ncbi:hypothetical protein BVG79_01082 [Ketogulonicigenium robustum]|uniref:Uncharacterized protein n=1 Tax=Ketogulonicigenium robustum TaxID=92947 RepID=A0A1W6NYV1_9RHOB|nr:hypothetical protein [Ketogulonicigenium robustum]ARO14428.1 hypothetical protein BVG79_01082 [Ketogulonicigenium robustum]
MTGEDDDLFPAATFDEAETAVPETPETPEAEAPSEQPDAPEAEGKTVPLAALHSVRDENKTLKARLAEFDAVKAQVAQMAQAQQPPAQPVRIDPSDPNFGQVLAQGVQRELVHNKLQQSRFFAEREFGKEIVDETMAYFNAHPQESQRFLGEPSPFHAAVEFYKKQKVAAEIGDNPEGYASKLREQIKQEILAEMAKESVKPSRGPSLATQPNLGSRAAPEWTGPMPLDDILKP